MSPSIQFSTCAPVNWAVIGSGSALSEKSPATRACTNFIIRRFVIILVPSLTLIQTFYVCSLISAPFSSSSCNIYFLLSAYHLLLDLSTRPLLPSFTTNDSKNPQNPSIHAHHGQRRRSTCDGRELGLAPVHVQYVSGRISKHRSPEGSHEERLAVRGTSETPSPITPPSHLRLTNLVAAITSSAASHPCPQSPPTCSPRRSCRPELPPTLRLIRHTSSEPARFARKPTTARMRTKTIF